MSYCETNNKRPWHHALSGRWQWWCPVSGISASVSDELPVEVLEHLPRGGFATAAEAIQAADEAARQAGVT